MHGGSTPLPAVAHFAAERPWDKVLRLDPESCSRPSNLVVTAGDSARIKLEGTGPRKQAFSIHMHTPGIYLHTSAVPCSDMIY